MLNLKGVKRICSESKCIPNGCYLQIALNVVNNELISVLHNYNNFSVFHDDNIINMFNIYDYLSMEDIKRQIKEKLIYLRRLAWLLEHFTRLRVPL